MLNHKKPIILFLIYIVLKIFSKRKWVALSSRDLVSLELAIEQLKIGKAERAERGPRRYRRWVFASKRGSAVTPNAIGSSIPLDESQTIANHVG